MNIQHIHGVAPLYTNTFLIITNAKHGILIDAAAEPGVYLKALDDAKPPKCFEGLPITLVAAALTSMTFMGFAGMADKLFG